MRMTPSLIICGCLIIFGAVIFVSVLLPSVTQSEKPSDTFRTRTSLEGEGRKIFIENGCSYCHSQYIRNVDWDLGSQRIAKAGDYIQDRPHQLGSARTGPDLSQEGGEHPDDWHLAHFTNPRYVRPESFMPPFAYLGREKINALISYKQSLGDKDAAFRVERKKHCKRQTVDAYR